jgi:mannitol/fructose-specific phosphotransferase system IIA component (Ntr-type)
MLISEIFRERDILVGVTGVHKRRLFETLTDLLCTQEGLSGRQELLETLWAREQMLPTVIAPGIALPHAQVPGFGRSVGALALSQTGIDYEALDGKPVHVIFMLVDDENKPETHLANLRNVALLIRNESFFRRSIRAATPRDAFAVLRETEELEFKKP